MSVPLQFWFKKTSWSILYLIRLQILYYDTSAYLLSATSRKYCAFSHIIYNFITTYMVTKLPHYSSIFFKYAQILCRYLYTALLHKYHLPPIIHNLPIINLHMFIQHCTKNKTYRNSQPSSVKHTFTAPFGANPRNTGINGSSSSGLRVKKLQDVPTC